ncbi:3-octaprenyl-4-hydroxybenzoate carboxy-lyase [Pyrobaculum islandicum DSM 4184]|uniref:Flavin prenyltransferase UbiX n=1 Tax=Pyrobaculum islandicum (strain DSM 4184 / JCM 9189 / GEO3) TaxID=384616 RepID=A1RUU8_PYRIL|nr:UbiX family flavin prenyltransferase [Pyrobaculum islandicum]ABL88730.1 3-octaprenyl-4-hydroxybenzoate carboxy-lyase [Pyrobaculum islandicum DSM 4184]
MRVFVGITGASGVIYGVKVLELLRKAGVEIHLSISKTAEKILKLETEYDTAYVTSLADYVWDENDLTAPPASGSFGIDAVAIVPCSTKTLAAIANGVTLNLITRAAEVGLKERKRVVLVIRESPLSLIHIKNMELATMAGAVVMPASPGFYTRPKDLDELVTTFAGRVLDVLGIKHEFTPRWRRHEKSLK